MPSDQEISDALKVVLRAVCDESSPINRSGNELHEAILAGWVLASMITGANRINLEGIMSAAKANVAVQMLNRDQSALYQNLLLDRPTFPELTDQQFAAKCGERASEVYGKLVHAQVLLLLENMEQSK